MSQLPLSSPAFAAHDSEWNGAEDLQSPHSALNRAGHQGTRMPFATVPRLLAAVLLVIALSACSARYQTPIAMGGDDDDAVCQSRGYVAGSPEYVACRKDRDVQRGAATAR